MPKKKSKKMQHPSVTEANKGKGKKSKKEERELTEAEKQALATYGYKCEDCGEYHELEDEYELEPHDEYELTGKKKKRKDKDKQRKMKRRSKEPKGLGEGEARRFEQSERIRRSEGSWMGDLPDPATDPRFCGGPNKPPCKKKYTSEPMPDYIMRALQPKKSIHPVYGKLRY